MTLKLATMEDLDRVVKLVEVFVKTSPYKNEEFDTEKVRQTVRTLLTDKNKGIVILYMNGEVPVGILGGFLTEWVFNRKQIAAELFWWVDPQFRSRKSLALREAFEFWAKRVGATAIQMSNLGGDEKVARYLERSGYDLFENAHLKRIA